MLECWLRWAETIQLKPLPKKLLPFSQIQVLNNRAAGEQHRRAKKREEERHCAAEEERRRAKKERHRAKEGAPPPEEKRRCIPTAPWKGAGSVLNVSKCSQPA